MSISEYLLNCRGVNVRFPLDGNTFFGKSHGHVHAVNDVSLSVCRGRVLGIVGESGSGKTTLGKSILRLIPVDAGTIEFDGINLLKLSEKKMRRLRSRIQVVFQDPYSSLNPRMTIFETLSEPLKIHGRYSRADRGRRVRETLDQVGLSAKHANRFPHEFSGGQRQRVAIGRALILNPEFIILDEPVSALDVSIQAQILNLLTELRRELNLTMIFISHDLAVVRHVSDDIAVMYLGRIVEHGSRNDIFNLPLHPYTKALLSAVPRYDKKRRRIVLEGAIPSPDNLPSGCAFHTRCPEVKADCATTDQRLEKKSGHTVACHHVDSSAKNP